MGIAACLRCSGYCPAAGPVVAARILQVILLFLSCCAVTRAAIDTRGCIDAKYDAMYDAKYDAKSTKLEAGAADGPRPVPSAPLVIGYAHNTTSGKVEAAIAAGVNVVCWSFVDMLSREGVGEDNGSEVQVLPKLETNLDIDAIRSLRSRHPHVLHVAAIGGWNGPHPPPGPTGEDWCREFESFNGRLGGVFDGIDWDLEGTDDRHAPAARFTMAALDVMADFAVCAKARLGLAVSMAPAESYLDALGPPEFSQWLNLPALAYQDTEADRALVQAAGFEHAGMQCYAYVMQRAGIDTFDWVALQLYEAFSRFLHDTSRLVPPVSQAQAVVARAEALAEGFIVNMPPPAANYAPVSCKAQGERGQPESTATASIWEQWMYAAKRYLAEGFQSFRRMLSGLVGWERVPKVPDEDTEKVLEENAGLGTSKGGDRVGRRVQVPLQKVVVGVANGWADGEKFCVVQPSELRAAEEMLVRRHGRGVRGAMFWTIDEEGAAGVHMAPALADVFRQTSIEDNTKDL